MFSCLPGGSPVIGDVPAWPCVPPPFNRCGRRVEVAVEDEFKQEFDVPKGVKIPHAATVECRLCGEPKVVHEHRPAGCDADDRRVKLVIIVQAVVRIVVRHPDGAVVASFLAPFQRRIEAVVRLPFPAVIVLESAQIGCGRCKLHPGWLFFAPKVVCAVFARVVFRVIAPVGP